MKNIRHDKTLIPELGKNLEAMVDRHAQPVCSGGREGHTLESLSRRILASPAMCQEFISQGLLTAEPLSKGARDGQFVFDADQLNEAKAHCLRAVVARIVEESDGDSESIQLASRAGLDAHVEAHTKQKVVKHFAARGGAVMLNRYRDEDEDEGVGTAGKLAIGAGVAGAGLYAAGHLQAKGIAAKIAARHGQAAGDAYLAKVGAGSKLKAGFDLTRAGVARGASKVLPGATGAAAEGYAAQAAKAGFANLRRAGGLVGRLGMVPGAEGSTAGAFAKAAAGKLGSVAGAAEGAIAGGLGAAEGAFAKAAVTRGLGAAAARGIGAAASLRLLRKAVFKI